MLSQARPARAWKRRFGAVSYTRRMAQTPGGMQINVFKVCPNPPWLSLRRGFRVISSPAPPTAPRAQSSIHLSGVPKRPHRFTSEHTINQSTSQLSSPGGGRCAGSAISGSMTDGILQGGNKGRRYSCQQTDLLVGEVKALERTIYGDRRTHSKLLLM